MSDFHVYIPYINRPDLLRRCVDSIPSLHDNLTILDNSSEGLPIEFYCWSHQPSVPLSFSQSQNFFLSDALNRGCDFYLWLHVDIKIPEGVFPAFLDKARSLKGTRWGALYTYYDTCCAMNTLAVKDVGGYDPAIRAYKSDQDFYHRMRLKGWETLESNLMVKELEANHLGSQSIRSDPRLAHLNGIIQQLDALYYRAKWGGDAGQEVYSTPFNLPE